MSIHANRVNNDFNSNEDNQGTQKRDNITYTRNDDTSSGVDQISGISINTPENRALKDNGLTPDRLEIISTIDYIPINLGVTGSPEKINILNKRFLEQQTTISKLITDLEGLRLEFADEYKAAEDQYRSVLVSTEADINILKLLLLMKVYGTKAPRFLEFMKQYEYTKANVSFLGNENLDRIAGILGINNIDDVKNNATNIFMHTYAALNFSTNFGNAEGVISAKDGISSNLLLRTVDEPGDSGSQQLIASTVNLARDLSFSNECVKIRTDKDGNKRLKEIIDRNYGNVFLTSKTRRPFKLSELSGIPVFSNVAKSTGNPFPTTTTTFYNIEHLLRDGDEPIITTLQARKKSILLPESGNSTYGNKTFASIDEVVDSAFSADSNIDLNEYENITQNFADSINDTIDFTSIAFKVGDYEVADGRGSTPLGSSVSSLTPADVATTALEVFNRKFAAVIEDRLTTTFADFGTEEHVNHARIFSYVLMRDNPGLCKVIFNAFINDFEAGFLTAKSIPEDDQPSINVLPGTDKIVDLSGIGTQLGKKIGALLNYYENLELFEVLDVVGPNTSESYGGGRQSTTFPEVGMISIGTTDAVVAAGFENVEEQANLRIKTVGSSYYSQQIGVDHRAILPMYANVEDVSTGDIAPNHLTVKIIAAEIIDAVLEVIRNLLPVGISVEPSGDSPIFPTFVNIKSPYGAGKLNYTSGIYPTFAMDLWVNTITAWNQAYTREGDNTTYYNTTTIKDAGSRVVEIMRGLMQNYDFISVRKTFDGDLNYDRIYTAARYTEERTLKLLTCGLVYTYPENSSLSVVAYGATSLYLSSIFHGYLNSILDSGSFKTINVPVQVPNSNSDLGGEIFAVIKTKSTRVNENLKTYALNAYRSNVMLDYLQDLLGSYAKRIEDYRNAITTIIESDESPIQETISNLIDEGNSGIDVLQNITSIQLVLKEIALEQETANESSAFIPQYSIVDSGKFNAMSALLNHKNFLFPESGTTKVAMVGIPATSLALHKESESVLAQQVYSIKIGYTDSEYPQLVFKPKTYNFARNYYVLPGAFSNISEGMSIEDILSLTNIQGILTQYQFRINESVGTDASISLQKIKSSLSGEAAFRNSVSYPHLYDNIVLSELLKEYYQLMAGLNFNESAFPTTPSGVNLQISEAAFNLADNLATVIDSVSSFPESIATSIRETAEIGQDISKINELIAGELTSVDVSLIEGVRSAYQTRLFSPEVVRSSSLSAKTFDRILAIPVDPDEFFVETEGDLSTSQEIIDAYLSKGVIEEATGGLKLKPRNYAEGTMAFGSFTVSLGPGVDNGDSLLGE